MKNKFVNSLCILLVFTLFFLMALGSGLPSKAEIKEIIDLSNTDEDEVGDVTIDEQVLVDQDGVKITAVEMVNDSFWGLGVKMLIENDTDKKLSIGCNAIIVNDYMITDYFHSTVSAGKKANEVMYLSSDDLEAAGIDTIGQIEIYFNVSDYESYATLFDTDSITIETSQFEDMDTEAMDLGKELLNQDGVRIVGMYVEEDSFWGSGVLLFIENTSGQDIKVDCDDMSVNGFMVTPYLSSTVYDGKMAIDTITIYESDLEDNDIESIEEVELTFHIYDPESYSTIFDSDTIVFAAE
jgi:hypothetical protein